MSRNNVCIIGNSSSACIKKAYDSERSDSTSDLKITFFSSSAYTTTTLELNNNHLSSPDVKVSEQFTLTSNGHSSINIEAFDAFVIYGLSFEFRDYIRAYRTHALLEDLPIARDRQIMSASVHSRLIDDLCSFRPGKRIAKLIREVSKSPIILAAAPCPAESILETASYSKFNPGEDGVLLDRALTRYEETYSSFATRSEWSAVLQPRATMSMPGFTEQKFASGGIGLPQNVARAIERNEEFRMSAADDPWHLNEVFGTIVLRELKRKLRSVMSYQES